MVAVQTEEREVHTPTLDRDVGGDVLNLICNSVLVVKARTSMYKLFILVNYSGHGQLFVTFFKKETKLNYIKNL